MNKLPYNDFGGWLRKRFPFRVQKISIDAGFTCPNRDGLISTKGCIYCNNQTFSPAYCNRQKSVTQQMEEGKAFFSKKYPEMKFLAYFQAFTNTYSNLEFLKSKYEEALKVGNVIGLVIGTRPDCVSDKLLDYLEELGKRCFLIIEYGIESANDKTLERINRGHTFECCRSTIEKTKARGILTGGHIIIGLPGEDAEESIRQAHIISSLPIDILKIHQMQVIKGTQLAKEFNENPFHIYEVDEYINVLTQYVERLRSSLILERFVSQSPKNMLIEPQWGMKNHEFTDRFIAHMKRHNTWQGRLAEATCFQQSIF